jgi:hypothetical protein
MVELVVTEPLTPDPQLAQNAINRPPDRLIAGGRTAIVTF